MIHHFADIYKNYDFFLIDIWGVVHDGYTPYPGTVEMINTLLLEKKLFFVSNAPRPNYIITKQLQKYDINITEEHVITSGDVTREYLLNETMQNHVIYHLGSETNQDILRDIAINTTTDLTKATLLLITAFIKNHSDIEQFDEVLKQAALLNVPAICANPDTEVISGESSVFCAGIFSARFIKFGGKVTYIGKPYKNIYDFAMKRLHKNVTRERILMIGDTIDTDILGAFNAGINSALVMTGNVALNFKKQQISDIITQEIMLDKLFHDKIHKPTYYIKGLF